MLVHTTAVVRLKCSFHYRKYLFVIILCILQDPNLHALFRPNGTQAGRVRTFLGCKSTHNFRNNKELREISVQNSCFFLKIS